MSLEGACGSQVGENLAWGAGSSEGHGMFWQGCAHQQQAAAQQRLGVGFRTDPDALQNQGVLPRQLHIHSHCPGSAPPGPGRRLAAVRRGPRPRQAQPQRQQGQQQQKR